MQTVIILIGIILGVAWRIAMPFFRKVMDGKIDLETFDVTYLYKGVATLLYAAPLGAILFFKFIPPDAPVFVALLASFVWGYTGQNLTDGAPAWLKPILIKLGVLKPKKPNPDPDTPGSNNPGHDNPGHGNPTQPQGNVSKIVDWFLGRNGSDPTKKAEARLELIVFAPIQFFFMSAIWALSQAAAAENWEVARILFRYIWQMALIAIALLWGRNIRSWFNTHMTDWLKDRQERKAKDVEFRAKLVSTEGVIEAFQDAVKLVGHGQQIIMTIPEIPVTPSVPPASDQP